MKTRINKQFLLPALIVASCWMLMGRAIAQPVSTLHTFPVSVSGINSDVNGSGLASNPRLVRIRPILQHVGTALAQLCRF
jgi:phosphate/sulfate permease